MLDRQLRQLLGDDVSRVRLDVTDPRSGDSAGLAVLIGTHRRPARAGDGLSSRGVTGPLRRVVESTGLDSLFDTEP